MSSPKISVLTPIYNTHIPYLRECIESVLAQSYGDFEYIILNDSPDNHELDAVVEEYSKNDSRIIYRKNERNMGISCSRNKLIQMAQGEYLAVCDHDDISLPDRFSLEADYLDKHPYVGVVSGNFEYIGDKNSITKFPERNIDIKITLTENCCLPHPACMLRRSILSDNTIMYEKKYSPAEDLRMWYRLMDLTDFYNLPDVLIKYREYGSNTSNRQEQLMSERGKEVHLDIRNKYPAYRAEYELRFMRHKKTITLFRCLPLLTIKTKKSNSAQFDALLFGFIPFLKCR